MLIMTHKQKIDYMRIAAGICCLGFSNEQLDLLVSLYDEVLKRKGQTCLSHVVDIRVAVEKRADAEKKRQLIIEAKKQAKN